MSEPKTNEPEFTVLMIGQRRAGKSSVLAAMLKSMEKLESTTGFQFLADGDTQLLMDKKAAHLEKIFYAHADDEEFTTLQGTKNNIDYGLMSDVSLSYRFSLGLKDPQKRKQTYSIEFVDIRGEDMLSDLESGDTTVIDRIGKASIIMIAVDSPALMEGKWKKGYGEFHDRVNIPDNIYESITKADARMREKLEDNQKLPPKLVLFVPLKCEKYYYDNDMVKLNEAVKKGYENIFAFFKAHKEYSVAIAPILTLGDVVFSRYETRQLASGKEVVDTFKDGVADSMRYTPRSPLFKFRDVPKPKFSPMFCEQPLMYLLAYVLGATGKLKEAEEAAKKQRRGFFGKVVNLVKHAVLFYLFGIWYAAFLGVRALMQDKSFMNQARVAVKYVKFTGHGYELVHDNMGLKAAVDAI